MRSAGDSEQANKRRLAGLLAHRFFLRFHLSLILGFSFAIGLLATKGLLLLGLESLLLRWPMAVFAAYGGFLLGIRVWLAYIGLGRHLGDEDEGSVVDGALDVADFGFFSSGGNSGSGIGAGLRVPDIPGGSSGGFGGGGASSDFAALAEGGGSLGDSLPSVDLPDLDLGGADDGCLPVLVLLAIAALLLAVFGVGVYVIWQAPFLLAEAAFEAALAAGLIRSAHRITDPGWIGGTVRASWKPLLWVLGITLLAAVVVEHYVPQARTLLEAVRLLLAATSG